MDIDKIMNYSSCRDRIIQDLSIKELYKNFQRLFILCSKDCYELTTNTPKFTLKQCDICVVRNSFFKQYLCLLDTSLMIEHFGIEESKECSMDDKFNNKELVLNLGHVLESDLVSFLSQFDGSNSIRKYIIAMKMNVYINYKYEGEQMRELRIRMLKTCDENMFWTLYSKCCINITLMFNKRKFRLNAKQLNEHSKNIIKKIQKDNSDLYLGNINHKNVYVDAANAIQKKGFCLYHIVASSRSGYFAFKGSANCAA